MFHNTSFNKFALCKEIMLFFMKMLQDQLVLPPSVDSRDT